MNFEIKIEKYFSNLSVKENFWFTNFLFHYFILYNVIE